MKKYTQKQSKFIELIANTQYAKTDLEIAMELNVKPLTLKNWRDLPGFRARLNRELRANLLKDWPDVMKQLTKKAKKGNMEAVKLFISRVTKLGKDDQNIDISGLNTEQRALLIEDIQERINQIKEGRPDEH